MNRTRLSTITRRSRCLEVRFYAQGFRESATITARQCVEALPEGIVEWDE